MFHKNTSMKFRHQVWGQEKVTFAISFLSSNDPDFFITRKGYVICENESGFHMKLTHVSFQFELTILFLEQYCKSLVER